MTLDSPPLFYIGDAIELCFEKARQRLRAGNLEEAHDAIDLASRLLDIAQLLPPTHDEPSPRRAAK